MKEWCGFVKIKFYVRKFGAS